MTGGAPAVRQAFALIDAVAAVGEPARFRDLVEASGLVKSTTHRIATTLVELDVLAADDDGYRLGARLVGYACTHQHSTTPTKELA